MSTKSSHGKKSVECFLGDFLSLCSDYGVDSQTETQTQIKEKWRTLFDKYKSVTDNNNKTGRDSKTFEFYDDIDEFLSGSDKVNPRFVKETKVQTKANGPPAPNPNNETNSQEPNIDPTTAGVAKDKANKRANETPNDAKNAACPQKKKRK